MEYYAVQDASNVALPLRLAVSYPERLLGLFSRGDPHKALLLFPCNSVHTFFMPRAIHIAFLDREGCVLESYRDVKPFCVKRCKGAFSVLEGWACEHFAWFQEGSKVQFVTPMSVHFERYCQKITTERKPT